MYSTPYRPANPYKQKEQEVVTVTENDSEETNMNVFDLIVNEEVEVLDVNEELEEEIVNEDQVVFESLEEDVEEEDSEDEELETTEVNEVSSLFLFDCTDRTIYKDKISPYNLPLYDLKRLVNVLSNQITEIGEDLVLFKNQNSKSILTTLTEDRFISYGLLKDNHDFSFKGKEVFVEVLEKLVYLASESNIKLEGLDEFFGLTVPSNLNNNSKTSNKSDVLLEINSKLDAILEMLKQ